MKMNAKTGVKAAVTATSFATAVLLAWAVQAQEAKLELKPGPGRDQVMGYCVMCHSVDYIQMNSVFMNRQVWDAEVTKMIKAYGAQVPADQIPVILDYLTANYGVATPPPK
jgi:sulfite dehydrogenase (cytochrome) subunit B